MLRMLCEKVLIVKNELEWLRDLNRSNAIKSTEIITDN